MKSNTQIKLGAIISYFTIFFNIISGLLYTPWLINNIGKNDYGLFILATTFINFFIFDFGIGVAISRFACKYIAEGKENKINDMMGMIYKLYFFIDFLILVALFIGYFFIDTIYANLTIAEIEKFKVIYVISATFSLISFPCMPFNGIIQTYEKFVFLKFTDLISKVLTVLMMIVMMIMGKGLYALVIVNTFIGTLILVVKYIYIKKNNLCKSNFRYKSKKMLTEVFNFSIWSSVSGIASRLVFNIVPTILAMFSGSAEITLFAISNTLEGYVYTFASALNGLFLPKVTRLIANEDNEEVLKLMIFVGKFQLVIVGLIIIGFISVGKDFMILWMGKDFLSAYYGTVIIVIPSLVSLTQDIANTMISVVNEVKLLSLINIITSIFNVVLLFIGIPLFGAFGACIAIGVTAFIRDVILKNLIYQKRLKLDIKRFFRECHLKFIIPFLIVLLLSIFLNKILTDVNILNFVGKTLFIVIIYAVLVYFMVLDYNEKKYLKKYFLKF